MKKRNAGLLAILAMLSIGAFGQAGTGAVAGTVMDPSRAVVPNAQVVLTNTSTGLQRTEKTDAAGNYRFSAVPVGPGYTVSVVSTGFSKTQASNITTTVGDVITEDFTLQAGGETTTIEVGATNEEQVQVETSAVSQVIDSTVWQDSPLEFRSQNQFVGLTAGAASDGGTGRGFAVNGARSGTGNFLVEGMDNNDQGQGGSGTTNGTGGAVTTISPDAIQEYRVISHNPSAEYGRAGGFATDTVLKGGTNKFHGSLFEYNRIQALAAEHFFSNLNGTKDSLIRNQFGGSVGGPIFKDKTFFFATVEIHHLRQGSPATGTVTTQAFLDFVNSGAFETFQESDPNGVCVVNTGAACPGALSGSATLGPVFKKLLAAEPRAFPVGTNNPDPTGEGVYTSGQIYPVPVYAQVSVAQKQALNQNRATMKIDHKLTNSDQLSFTYLLDLEQDTIPFAGGGATFGPDEVQVGGSQLFTGNWTHTFSPTLQNLFRAGYTRHVSNFSSPNAAGVPQIVAFDSLASGFGEYAGFPQLFTENEFLYEDSLTKVVRNHSFKAGFRFIRTRNGSSFYNDVNGSLYPWSVEDLITDETFDDQVDRAVYGGPTYGSLAEATAAVDSTTNAAPDPYRGYRANEFAAYFQDDWKATNKLTLNLGVRWEYFGPPHNAVPGLDSNVYFGTATTTTPNGNPFLPTGGLTAQIQGATFQQRNSNIWNKDTNNFAPRVGFAFDPTGRGKFAIRGGFGIGFDRLYNNVYENIRFNSPHFSDNSIGYEANGVIAGALEQPALLSIPFTANGLFASYGGKPVPRHIDQNLVTAYYEQANLGFEYELKQGYVLETNYIGTFGRKLVGLKDANNYDGRTACTTLTAACAAAGYTAAFTSARPTTLFNADNFRSNGFNSNYNGLQVSLRKGYSNGLMFLANYTYSKALDQISDVFSVKTGQTGITDPLNPSYDYGPADFDTRHIGTFTVNYTIPYKKRNLLLGGWGISPILSLQSGTPFSSVDTSSTFDPNKDARYVDRAVYVGGGNQKNAVHRNGNPYFNGMLTYADFAGGKHTGSGGTFTCPLNVNQGLWCDAPESRNAFYGPHLTNLDMAVSKRFFVTEQQHFTAQASFFNAFNHPNFTNPVSDLNNSAEFGKPQSTGDPRVTQLSLRYDF